MEEQEEAGKVGCSQVRQGLPSWVEASEMFEVIIYLWIIDCRMRCPCGKTQWRRQVT